MSETIDDTSNWARERRHAERHFREVSASFKTLDDIFTFIEKSEYQVLIHYHRTKPESRRRVFQTLYDALHLDFKGRTMLELGPGYGDALELARERGADSLDFIDLDPYVVILNNLRGFTGHRINFHSSTLTSLEKHKYDVIFARGGVNIDALGSRDIPCESWLYFLEQLASAKGQIILCPTFDRQEVPYKGHYYYCKDVDAARNGPVVRSFLERGYKIIFVPGVNDERIYPFTFYKNFADPGTSLLRHSSLSHGGQVGVLYPMLLANHVKHQWRTMGIAGKNNSPLKIAVYGAGKHTVWLEQILAVDSMRGPRVIALLDDEPVDKNCFFNLSPIAPSDFDVAAVDAILLSTDVHVEQMSKRCRTLFGDRIRLITLYDGFPPGPYVRY